jgi:hypothetical protein
VGKPHASVWCISKYSSIVAPNEAQENIKKQGDGRKKELGKASEG